MSDLKTIIGKAAIVRGSIEGHEDLVVQGRVEGSISLSKMLTVDPGGMVQAEVSVQRALIHGVLVGNIEAEEGVHIASDGRVVGDIRAPRVVMEEGAAFNGNVDMGEIDLEAEAPPPKTKPVSLSVRPPAPVPEPEPEPVRPTSRMGASFSRPPMPMPSRSPAAPVHSVPPEKRAAPEPRVRPVGHVKIKRPSL